MRPKTRLTLGCARSHCMKSEHMKLCVPAADTPGYVQILLVDHSVWEYTDRCGVLGLVSEWPFEQRGTSLQE